MKKLLSISLALLWLATQPARAEIAWHWQDRFSAAEKAKLTEWITAAVAGVEELVGPYPFDVHISFYRAESGESPVPWARTVRSRRQGINFHVDPGRSAAELAADWTAYHELSHLFFPYVGKSNAWFAEGFASYMQYQVMLAMGIIDGDQVESRYRERIDRAERRYDLDDLPFDEAAGILVARREYPTMYWGGAVYFLQADRRLRQQGDSMLGVLREFVACCRLDTRNFTSLIDELDRIASQAIFSEQLELMRSRPGFPDNSGAWPEVTRPASSLRK